MSLLPLIIYYQLFAFPSAAVGAPVGTVASQLSLAAGNLTTLRTEPAPPWASSATYRGTTDILWSCLLTLLACVYTAIHLNVPPANWGRLRSLWRKLQWVGMALFAPELVLFIAYSQYSEARDLVKELNRLRFGEDESTKCDTVQKWFESARKGFNCRKKTGEGKSTNKVTSQAYRFAI
jgi:hypothetical protein